MSKKLLIILLAAVMAAALGADLFADSYVEWHDDVAETYAKTTLVGATDGSAFPYSYCEDNDYATPPPYTYSFCWAFRDTFLGVAVAIGYADKDGDRKISINVDTAYGHLASSGKAAGDTAVCSTHVEHKFVGDDMEIQYYARLLVPDPRQSAKWGLTVIASGSTFVSGEFELRGGEFNVLDSIGFNVSEGLSVEDTLVVMSSNILLDITGFDTSQVVVHSGADVAGVNWFGAPSITRYGMALLIVMLIATAFFVFFKQRKMRKAPA
jgi:hypothetical protein